MMGKGAGITLKTKGVANVIIRSVVNINSVVVVIEVTRIGGVIIAIIDRSADEIERCRNIDNFCNVIVFLIVDFVVDGKLVLAEMKD